METVYDPRLAVKLVADSEAQVRKQDVYRLFDQGCASREEGILLLSHMLNSRNDLAEEILVCFETCWGEPRI